MPLKKKKHNTTQQNKTKQEKKNKNKTKQNKKQKTKRKTQKSNWYQSMSSLSVYTKIRTNIQRLTSQ